ncbi:MAG: DUF4190 domain-containing protein [Clostridia bacterium]|nr:DUF4190 domain-containing protein [Clostridia bacterium]
MYNNMNNNTNYNMNNMGNNMNYNMNYQTQPPKNGMATASLVLGILGLLLTCACIGFPLSIIGLVLGIASKKNGPSGKATAGIVLSAIGIGFSVLLILMSMVSPDTKTTQKNNSILLGDELSDLEQSIVKTDNITVDTIDFSDYKYITIDNLDVHSSDLIGEKVLVVDKVANYDSSDKKLKISVPDTYHYYTFTLAADSVINPSKMKNKTVAIVGTIVENDTKILTDASAQNCYVVAVGDDCNQYKLDSTSQELKDKFTLQKSEISKLSEEDYKANCVTYTSSDYNKILRNPSQYKDKMAKLSGKVDQVVQGLFGLYTTIYVKDTAGNKWGITYSYGEDESHKLEGDSITIWGMLDGTQTTETILGKQVELPYISAKYIK